MRPIVKSVKNNADGTPSEYNPWGDAKPELVEELGSFCSFCEKYNSRSALHVEHVYGKKCVDAADNYIYDHLKYRWDNFLLACVNCNSVKNNKDIALTNPALPHINNLIHFIESTIGGVIVVKNGLLQAELNQTNNFISLVGLDRLPGHPQHSDKDDRWDERLKVYDIAQRQLRKYEQIPRKTDLDTIVDLARTNGCFSIWYYTFKKYDEVLNVLINGMIIDGEHIKPFPGTHNQSFDSANHFKTIVRP
jgi:hypothetical protein